MRKILLVFAVFFALVGGARAQIPVTVTSDVPATFNHIEEMMKWAEQITQMKSQLSQLESTYNSLNGIRGMGALFNNPTAWKYLPPDWQQVYKDLETGKSTSLTGSINAIRAAYSTYDKSKLSNPSGEIGKLYERGWNNAGVAKGFAEDGYKQASARLTNLQGLLDKVDAATDQKDILDLQARIQAEQTMLQNEQVKLGLVQQLALAEQQLQQQSLKDSALRSLGSNSISVRRTK